MLGERRVHKKIGSSIVIKFPERSLPGNTITVIADSEFSMDKVLNQKY
jgi:hypothetical protein